MARTQLGLPPSGLGILQAMIRRFIDSHLGFPLSLRARAAAYILVLLALNTFFVKTLFFVDFTRNMQHNAGSFMAISRFILQQWPHLDWFPWWFNGEPFENTYTPMLHLINAAFAGIFGCSTARAFNFVTAFFYVTGPVFLFLFAWRISRFLETSFLAALLYSLFSPVAFMLKFRDDLGGWFNPWRLRVLVYYGEGPHTTVLSVLPLALLLIYLALTTRKYVWCAAAGALMAFIALVNAFGAVDLAVGCACLVAALHRKEMVKAALLISGIAILAYLWASPFLTPTLIRTIAKDSQTVGGNYAFDKLITTQGLILAGFLCVWCATIWVRDYYTRFSLLISYVFFSIVAMAAFADRAALPQPYRYSLEMELGLSLAVAFSLRPLIVRLPAAAMAVGVILLAVGVIHQTEHYRRYGRTLTQKLDITQTIEYKMAKWLDANLGALRAFVAGEAGTWLNVFADTPQMSSGHDPFNPNWVEGMATYAIYSGQNAGARDAEISILWLKAFGNHAVYVPGPLSKIYEKPFSHPEKFQGVLPVLWHQEDDTIYAIPQRTKSLAHVVPADAIVNRQPINGLDVDDLTRYVAALDDAALPVAALTWATPSAAHISAILRPGQVLSVQTTYDIGWLASANGRPARVIKDGLGLTAIQADCNGQCDIDFVFDGGMERKVCRALSWTVTATTLIGALIALRMRRRT
jgi:hypothetical protein